ncbi:MAG: hypothetical protein OZSIB_4027 [Candidatus Ozemobacter sibiricus]|uniref:Uncharacterized protein n=1 Tax=Candidatus Ozemobacter sibiricus TaxID=2268124 RepID=A0A367ZP45_9BACT|nr:MAG: hypothetical protein OZSIB_4027 [Candidatus Ozemobacter sibiricus]
MRGFPGLSSGRAQHRPADEQGDYQCAECPHVDLLRKWIWVGNGPSGISLPDFWSARSPQGTCWFRLPNAARATGRDKGARGLWLLAWSERDAPTASECCPDRAVAQV